MGVTYREVVENGLISQAVMECIPETCECGEQLEFTDSLRQLYCSNPQCIYKVAARLEAMAKALKADGWGESTCIAACREFHLISPYQAFNLQKTIENGDTSTSISAFEKKVGSLCNRERRRVELWEVVKLAGIPNIETTAYKIFNGYNTLKEAFDDIESGQVPFIADKLGLKNSESGVMAVTVYNNLMAYKAELLFGEKQFEIYKPSGVTLYVAITGGVYGYKNKSEFISYINTRYEGKVNAMLMTSVTTQVDILIADGDRASNKFNTANRLNERYIEKGIKDGLFSSDDIGKFVNENDLHPIGEQIYITESGDVFERLDKVFG